MARHLLPLARSLEAPETGAPRGGSALWTPDGRGHGSPWRIAGAWSAVLLLLWLAGAELRGEAQLPAGLDAGEPHLQTGAAWEFSSYLAESELARRYVFDIAFEPDSTAWIAASDGLHRYDGYSWRRFTRTNGLPSDFVRSVCWDRQGRLWVGTDRGAGVYDGRTFRTLGLESELATRCVRRIYQDPDGGMWFCCDSWPDRSRQGGLTHWRDGSAKTYTQADGLMSDYLLGYHLDAQGRRYAFSRGFPHRQDGERWAPLVEPGLPANLRAHMMADSGGGETFLQTTLSATEGELYVRTAGRWRPAVGGGWGVICSTRAGQVLQVGYGREPDTLWLQRWDGARFLPISARIPSVAGSVEAMAEAPDGSIWCVGLEVVLRWRPQGGEWTPYSDLPPARWVDATGGIWFADRQRAWRRTDAGFERVPDWRGDMTLGSDGTAWTWTDDRVTRWTGVGRQSYGTAETGLARVDRVRTDGRHGVWVRGLDESGRSAVAARLSNQWHRLPLPHVQGKRIESEVGDVSSGLWLLVGETNTSPHTLLYVTSNRVTSLAVPPPFHNYRDAGLWVDAQGVWLFGSSGLYRQTSGERGAWRRVDELLGNNVYAVVGVGQRTCAMFDGRTGGACGYALYEGGVWRQFRGEVDWFWKASPRGAFYLQEGRDLRVVPPSGLGAAYQLALPVPLAPADLVEGAEHEIWLSSSNLVLRYRPDSDPPRTFVERWDRQLREGESLRVRLRGVKRWAPGHPQGAFLFSWRLGTGEWSPFRASAEVDIPTRGLDQGSHWLWARCQLEGRSIDPKPVGVEFTVMPVPLQERVWFAPLLAALLALLVLLAASASLARRKVARAAGRLEEVVRERTGQLEQANASLTREIAQREQAQQALQQSEQQLRQAQKMEAVGQLAGGVAHDFNNILTVIQGHCGLLLEEPSFDADERESLTQISQSTERAATLTRQLLLFGRRQAMRPQALDLNGLVEGLLKLLRRLLGERIALVFEPSGDLPAIEADPGMIEQVVMNLCVNARDAMGEGGVLRMTTTTVAWGVERVRANPESREGRFVCLSVSDTGCGMDETLRARIFEPFFTTKAVGKGTGLGLATVHSIVKQHRGWAEVESTVGKGSTFRVYFPASATPISRPQPAELPAPAALGRETLLLVEDEPAVRRIAAVALRRQGYQVIEAANGIEAHALWSVHRKQIDLLFTDMVMPEGMSGLALAERLWSDRPDLAVLLASGYSLEMTVRGLPAARRIAYLPKPYSLSALVTTVRQCLDAARPTVPTPSPSSR